MMNLFSQLGQQWEDMRDEISGLKKGNVALKQEISTLKKVQEKELRAFKKEILELKIESTQLLEIIESLKEDNDVLRTELSDTKSMCKKALKRVKSNSDTVESLKKVFNRTLVASQGRAEQLKQIEADVASLRKEFSTRQPPSVSVATALGSPRAMGNDVSSTWASKTPFHPAPTTQPMNRRVFVTGATSQSSLSTNTVTVSTPTVSSPSSHKTGRKQLSPEEKQREIVDSCFCGDCSIWHPIGAWGRMSAVVAPYDVVHQRSECMDTASGLYTTPVEGRYEFCGNISVSGNGGASLYLCSGDGRREKLLKVCRQGDGYIASDDVVWNCPAGLKVWLEAEGEGKCRGLKYVAGFLGGLGNN